MARENRTRYAVLGMLMSGPKSGYDLKREFEERIGHFWSESLGQIYPTLHRLHDEGMVSARVRRAKGRPERKVYRITVRGREAFRAWLEQPPGPTRVRNELLLKIFFGPESTPEQVLTHLDRFAGEQEELRGLYRFFEGEIERLAASELQREYWRLTLLSGRRVNEARLAWCREARAAVAALATDADVRAGDAS